jgi:hypothetical protein
LRKFVLTGAHSHALEGESSTRDLAFSAPGGRTPATAYSRNVSPLQILEFSSQIFLRFTEFLLKPPQQLFVFSLCKREVVIGQLRVFLLELAFHFIPAAFEL